MSMEAVQSWFLVDIPYFRIAPLQLRQRAAARLESGQRTEYARNVGLDGVRVTWGQNLPDYYAHALEARHTLGLKLENFQGDAPHSGRGDTIVIEEGDVRRSYVSAKPSAWR